MGSDGVDLRSSPGNPSPPPRSRGRGAPRLHRWGLLDQIHAGGAPPTRRVRLDTPDVVLEGTFPAYEGVDALYSPRRTVLDGALVGAARAAGAEVREQFRVEELVWDD